MPAFTLHLNLINLALLYSIHRQFRVFQMASKGWGNWKFCSRNSLGLDGRGEGGVNEEWFWTFYPFLMLKKHSVNVEQQLTKTSKISMVCVYIKCEIKVKTSMPQQWLQLNIKFLLLSWIKIVVLGKWGWKFGGGVYWGIFSGENRQTFWLLGFFSSPCPQYGKPCSKCSRIVLFPFS